MAVLAADSACNFPLSQQSIHRDYQPVQHHSLQQQRQSSNLVGLVIDCQLLEHEAQLMAYSGQQMNILAAQRGGPAVFKRFIDSCKLYPDVKDPRLAWMELDYVVMVSATDPIEAKKIFREVKKRTPTDSPIYPRIKSLESTYE